MILRPGDWRPGGDRPVLLAAQLTLAFQAALRGLEYLGDPTPTGRGPLAPVASALDASTWGYVLLGGSLLVLVGLAVRRAAVLVLAHSLLAAIYLGMGLPVLAHTHVGPLSLTVSSVLLGALGVWTLVTRQVDRVLTRLVAVVLLAGVGVALGSALGLDYRTGTGLAGAGVLHAALAYGVATASGRQRIAPLVEDPQ